MTDKEIDLLVRSFLLPPPCGFTKEEKKQILEWIKNPSVFIDAAEKQKKRILS
jgi:hypothetical protein